MMDKAELRIYTLGTFAVSTDGKIIETFLTRKTALLLVYLAMNPGAHARETLAPLLWSETTDAQALKNLRTVLSDLRKNTPDAITITRQSVQITDGVWIDASEFEQQCETFFTSGQMAHEELLALVDLYCGDFLHNIPIRKADGLETWVDHQRNRFQKMYEQLLYQVVDHCVTTGDAYTGVTLARRLVMLNPLWEAAQRQLMQLLMQLDQRGEAQMQYKRLVDLLDEELGTTPASETVDLYEQIKSGTFQPNGKTSISGRIVLPDVPYVAPETSATALRELLDKPDCRLVTLTGISGTGKSTLATFIAYERQDSYEHGVAIVKLESINDAQELAQAILNALDISIKGGPHDDQVIAALKDRHMLMVLDNYQQLLPETTLIARIIDETPNVQLLITSQVALNLRGEWMLPLTGLQDEDVAFQLFRKTAERIQPRFDLSAYRDDVAQICTLLEGLPLGIVIAAGQVKYSSPPQILNALRDDPLALTSTYQDMPERHQGFTHLVSATLKHLSDEEKRALRALVIFRGSFQHEAALAVAGIDMTTFIALVDKSLVQRAEYFRYRIHSLLRRIFLDQLTISGEHETVCQRLTAYYIEWCHDLYRRNLEKADTMRRIEAEHVNIWHLDMLTPFEQGRYLLEIVPVLNSYWRNRGFREQVKAILAHAVNDDRYPPDLRARGMVELAAQHYDSAEQETLQTLCEQAMKLAPDNLYVQVDALQQLARLNMQRGDHQVAWGHLMTVLELEDKHRQSNDPRLEYLFLGNHNGMGLAAMKLGKIDIARTHYSIAIQGYDRRGEPLMAAQARNNLALLDMRAGRYADARQHFEAIIPLAQAAGSDSNAMIYMGNLGKTLMLLGDYAGAYSYVRESMQMALRLGYKESLLNKLETFAELAYRIDQFSIAAQLYDYLLHRSEIDGIAFWPSTIEKIQQYVEQMQDELGSHYDQLTELGRKLSQDAVVALAYSLKDHVQEASS